MAVIAGLQTLHQQGPPADTGTFQLPCSVLVFQHTFSGTTYIVALRSGERGWVPIDIDTDASTTLQSAFDAATYRVFVRTGTYVIETQLTADSDLDLEAESWQTIFYLADGADCHVLFAQTESNIVIRNLQIDGNEDNQTGGQQHSGIVFEEVTDGLIEHCKVINCIRFGIVLTCYGDLSPPGTDTGRYCTNVDVLHCTVEDCCWNNIQSAYCYDILIQGNRVTGASDVGISVWDGGRVTISTNTSHDNNKTEGSSNSHWDFAVEQASDCKINDNQSYGSNVGIAVRAGAGTYYDNQVSDNHIRDCVRQCITCIRQHRLDLEDNHLYLQTNGSYDMIYIDPNCDYVNVTGGTLSTGARDGISVNGADNTCISGLTIVTMGRDGIRVQDGDDTVISDCRIDACTGLGVKEAGTSDWTLLDGCNLRGNGTPHDVNAANSLVGDVLP